MPSFLNSSLNTESSYSLSRPPLVPKKKILSPYEQECVYEKNAVLYTLSYRLFVTPSLEYAVLQRQLSRFESRDISFQSIRQRYVLSPPIFPIVFSAEENFVFWDLFFQSLRFFVHQTLVHVPPLCAARSELIDQYDSFFEDCTNSVLNSSQALRVEFSALDKIPSDHPKKDQILDALDFIGSLETLLERQESLIFTRPKEHYCGHFSLEVLAIENQENIAPIKPMIFQMRWCDMYKKEPQKGWISLSRYQGDS